MREAFVTGGSGFVGRALIRALRAQGCIVRALARTEAAEATVREAGAEPVRGDLDDGAALRSGMAGCDVVFHAAAFVKTWGTRDEFFRANVAGTDHVLAAARASSVRALVHVSTEAVLAGERPIVRADETWPHATHPAGLYPLTKGIAEERVVLANSPDFRAVIIRPRLIWGKGDTSVLPQIAEAVRAGRFSWIDGGRYLTSTCHVDNVCEGALLAAQRGRAGEAYFLTDGDPVEMRGFLTALLRTQGLDPGSSSIPGWLARALARGLEAVWEPLGIPGEPPVTYASVKLIGEEVTVNDAKARRELGYIGATTREQGLREMEGPVDVERA